MNRPSARPFSKKLLLYSAKPILDSRDVGTQIDDKINYRVSHAKLLFWSSILVGEGGREDHLTRVKHRKRRLAADVQASGGTFQRGERLDGSHSRARSSLG
jgi:hypothetical protein